MPCIFSVENVVTGSKLCSGNLTDLCLLYKRMEVQGRFRWPRNQLEVKQLTWQQFDWLMSGLEIEQPKAFKPTE
ncbi:MAG: IS66 family insertion sequence element accessory protein TnpB [Blautia sp.]